MGVMICPAEWAECSAEEIADGYMSPYLAQIDVPESIGWTYSSWRGVMDALHLEACIYHDRMHTRFLRELLYRQGHVLQDDRYRALASLLDACDRLGTEWICWA